MQESIFKQQIVQVLSLVLPVAFIAIHIRNDAGL